MVGSATPERGRGRHGGSPGGRGRTATPRGGGRTAQTPPHRQSHHAAGSRGQGRGQGRGRGRGGRGAAPAASREAIAINRTLLEGRGVDAVEEVVRRSLRSFNLVNCVTALQRFAKLSFGPPNPSWSDNHKELLLKTAELLSSESNAGRCEPRHLSGALWACARLGAKCSQLEGAAAQGIAATASEFKPQELANTIWASAKLKKGHGSGKQDGSRTSAASGSEPSTGQAHTERGIDPELAAATALSLEQSRSEWTPQGLSNVCWALGSLGACKAELLNSLLDAVEARAQELNPQELANTIWALAKLKDAGHGGDLLAAAAPGPIALARQLHKARLQEYATNHLANVVWGCAKLGLAEGAMQRLLGAAMKHSAASMNAQELAMCSWGLATWGQADPDNVLQTLVASARKAVHKCEPRQMATLVWAMAKLASWDQALAADVAKHFVSVASSAAPQDLANLAWAFAKMDDRRSELLEAVGGATSSMLSTGGVQGFSPQHLTMLLWALASLGGKPQQAVRALAKEAEARVGEFNTRDLTNTTAALAMLRLKQPVLLRKIGDRAAASINNFNSQELLKFLGAYDATGAVHEGLATAVGSEREMSYSFPAISCEVVLRATTPRRFSKAETSGRVDNSCSGGGRGNTGVALWEGSYVLAEWLSRQGRASEKAAAKRILDQLGVQGNPLTDMPGKVGVELGAGLGLPSIVVGNRGMSVVSTDGDPSVLELLSANTERNVKQGTRVAQLVWGTPDPLGSLALSAAPDLILAADVVYGNDPVAWSALVSSMADLAGESTVIVLSNMQRYPLHHPMSEAAFLAKALEPAFRFVRLPQSSLHPDYCRSGAGSCAVYIFVKKKGAQVPPPARQQPPTSLPAAELSAKERAEVDVALMASDEAEAADTQLTEKKKARQRSNKSDRLNLQDQGWQSRVEVEVIKKSEANRGARKRRRRLLLPPSIVPRGSAGRLAQAVSIHRKRARRV